MHYHNLGHYPITRWEPVDRQIFENNFKLITINNFAKVPKGLLGPRERVIECFSARIPCSLVESYPKCLVNVIIEFTVKVSSKFWQVPLSTLVIFFRLDSLIPRFFLVLDRPCMNSTNCFKHVALKNFVKVKISSLAQFNGLMGS